MAVAADEHFVTSACGHRMYVDPADMRALELRSASGTLNPGASRLWDVVLALHDWQTIVDVGANYGEMLLGAKLSTGARVLGFEPSPRVLPFLRRSVEESGLTLELRDVAVASRAGTAEFLMDTTWSGRSGLASTHRTDADHPLRSIVVDVSTLDSELALQGGESVCVKVDVEGGEFDVLAGARGLIGRREPWAIMVEIAHLSVFEQAHLAQRFTMRALDLRTGELVRVPPASPQMVSELLAAGWLHPHDVVLSRGGS